MESLEASSRIGTLHSGDEVEDATNSNKDFLSQILKFEEKAKSATSGSEVRSENTELTKT